MNKFDVFGLCEKAQHSFSLPTTTSTQCYRQNISTLKETK